MNAGGHDGQLHQLRTTIYNKINQCTLSEQTMIQQQNRLLEECRDRLERRKAYDSLNSFSLNVTGLSSIDRITFPDDSFRNRFSEEFQSSILNSAIKEIKSNCSDQTLETITSYVVNNKSKQYEDLKRDYERKQKEVDELSVLIIIKQKDINSLERDLADLRVKEDFLDDQRKKNKKKAGVLDEKEKRLHNAEMSLIFKEKLNLQGKRRYQRQKDIHEAIVKRLQQIHDDLTATWQKILQKMSASECKCEAPCWRQEVMKKCKDQLVQQRKMLQEQSEQIEGEYETMRTLSEQMKKVFITVKEIPESMKKIDEVQSP